jgi:N-acetylneuraminic acid mutarotase
LRNELFVVGGCFNQSLQEHVHPFGFRFSPRLNKWTTIAPMLRERCRFSLTVFGKALFAFGGCTEQADEIDEIEDISGAMCERYDVEHDTWTAIAPFPGGRWLSQHASTRYQNTILVSGGLDRDVVLSTVLLYHPDHNVWEAPGAARTMPTPRADHVMLVWRDVVFFCGGWFEDEAAGNRVLVDTLDVYDPNADTWSVETRVPTPRYHAGIVIVHDKLYVIGGFHNDSLFDRATAGLIECYDLESRKWSTEKRYPQEVWEHACVSLYIPRCREDMDVMPFC